MSEIDAAVSPTKDFAPQNVQGNILRGYRHGKVRHLMLEVSNRDVARRFLAASADGTQKDVPRITRSADWSRDNPLETCFNIGITFAGLRALGLPAEQLATFPSEYAEGMARRAIKLGDFGQSAPENWPSPFDQPDRIHIVASIYSNDETAFDTVEVQVGRAFTILGTRNGRNLPDDKVFFGYTDSISQPRFKHVFDPDQVGVDEPKDPLGTVLLGYVTHFEGVEFAIPEPKNVFRDSAFNAFRVLQQNTDAFEAYLSKAATELEKNPRQYELLPKGAEANINGGTNRHEALREVVAAQMCGRWRNGTPYELSPNSDVLGDLSKTNYDYKFGSRCPAGSHMRRANPRGGPIVQRVANYSRRLVRRGMSYGPDPETGEHGLLGNFIGANYGAQFEAVMCDWINFGLQDPEITGTNDPLLGANEPETSVFYLTTSTEHRIRLSGFPRFVIARGGAYTMLPSLSAIRYLSGLKG
ncbi:hypothetical protein [Ruegeria marina]|uniref:DyP dimeric alpha+beta barrel domain-containing protein n=1 Tax=Ruegeria marina TaxID=639004 RepID=A0A1G7BVY6_9RHOB|nr:hypothetical protein [Ruegeria marina]SDE30730.1 hypothetical protein SAMN04488239_1174 [Ruegeria marina]